ncbi:hypothetical protein [Cytobacillus praedii]|uniref:Uncharacterized protein n=1 Tax=Cytobacillus praedii TaxID=1742358 RepID=A0A4R1ATM1_9BACI|nr:hypothetical protein [Cytobacillus praedii]TCJ01571.1 hypothetical protein E0Y62_23350 [Cytobacillus praedii]
MSKPKLKDLHSQIKNKFDSIDARIESHVDNTDIHVTPEQVTTWNAKSEFDGNYNSLNNKPVIPSKTSQLENDSSLETTIGSQTKADKSLFDAKTYTDEQVNTISSSIGDLTALATTDKTNLVNALNEINNKPSGGGGDGYIKFADIDFTSSNQTSSLTQDVEGYKKIRVIFNKIGRIDYAADLTAWTISIQLGTTGQANTHVQTTVSGSPPTVNNARLMLLNVPAISTSGEQRRIDGVIEIDCASSIYYTESMLWFPGNWQTDATPEGGGSLITNHTMIRGWRTTYRRTPLDRIQFLFVTTMIAKGKIEFWGIPND